MRPDSVYMDLDDTLVDLAGRICGLYGKTKSDIHEYDKSIYEVCNVSREQLWEDVAFEGARFWEQIPILPWADDFVRAATMHGQRLIIMTALPLPGSPARDHAAVGKLRWLKNYFGSDFDDFAFTRAKEAFAGPNKLLVDDRVSHIQDFIEAGGQAVYAPQPWNIKQATYSDPSVACEMIEFLCSSIRGVDFT